MTTDGSDIGVNLLAVATGGVGLIVAGATEAVAAGTVGCGWLQASAPPCWMAGTALRIRGAMGHVWQLGLVPSAL